MIQSYVGFDYYLSTYLNGSEEAVSSSASFNFLAQKASMMIYTRTFGRSEWVADSDEVKCCTCALVESLNEEMVQKKRNYKSESVGEHSVTYKDEKTEKEYKREREEIYKVYLFELGILDRRVFR